MARSAAMKEQLAQAYAARASKLSLHTGDPGTTGANEATGIARASLSWTSGSADGVVTADPVSFNVPAGSNLTHVGIWDSAGVYLDSFINPTVFDTAGTYSITITYTQS